MSKQENTAILWTFLLSISLFAYLSANASVTMKGANGVDVDFAGIRAANQAGLYMMVTPEQGEIFVPWERFDFDDMAERHPSLHRVYQEQRGGGRDPVDLNIGIYERMRTIAAFSEQMKQKYAEKATLAVPPMTYFFDMSQFTDRSGRGYFRTISDYSNFSTRSTNYLREYERFLAEFFGIEGPVRKTTYWLTYGSRRWDVVTEARPPQTSVKKSPVEILLYVTDPDVRSHPLMVAYLNGHPETLALITNLMEEKQAMIESGYLMISPRDLTAKRAAVDTAAVHYQRMADSLTRNANLQRDTERYLREWRVHDF